MVLAMSELVQSALSIHQLKAFSRTARFALVQVSLQQILSLQAQIQAQVQFQVQVKVQLQVKPQAHLQA
jgi:hypothetical protein